MGKFYPRGMRGILRERRTRYDSRARGSKRTTRKMRSRTAIPVSDLVLLAAGHLKDVDISPFTRWYIKEMLPDVNPGTVSVQIQSMTINTPGHGVCGEKYRKKCFERVARGQYVLTPYGEKLLEGIKTGRTTFW